MTLSKKRGIAQKLISFEDSTRGYAQVDKEVATGWSVVSIIRHENKYICVLEKAERIHTIQDVLSAPLSSKKRQIVLQD